MKFTRFEFVIATTYISFRLIAFAINLHVFEQVPLVAMAFSVFNTLVVYTIVVSLVIYLVRLLPIQKYTILKLVSFHFIFAFVFSALFESLSYALIVLFAPNANEIIASAFSMLHWKVIDDISSYWIVVLILYVFQYAKMLSDERLLQSELREQVKTAELNALKYQLNPHFLFNSLNSINALILEKSDKAQQMLLGLSDFLRFSLSVRDQQMISLELEIEQIERYLAIEKIRFSDRLTVEIQNTASPKAQIPTLLLQPLIENAIKHSVAKSIESCTIKIRCEELDDKLEIRISNDLLEAANLDGLQLGLKNVENRLKMNFPENYIFEIEQSERFEVRLVFPKNEAE